MHRLTAALRVAGMALCLSVGWGTAVGAQDGEFDCIDFEFQEEAQAELDADPSDPNGLDPGGDGIACALLPSRDDEAGNTATPVAAEDDALDDETAADEDNEAAGGGGGDRDRERERERKALRLERQREREAAKETPVADETPAGEDERDNRANRERDRERNRDDAATCDDFATQEEAQDAFDDDPGTLADLDTDGDGLACADGDDETLPSEDDDGTGGVFICDDFLTQEEAQAAFDDDPEILIDLDNDGDGLACAVGDDVTLPSEDDTNRIKGADLDCIDFEFQEEAQDELEDDLSDPNNLDPSGDGFACSELPSEDGTVRVTTMPRTGDGPDAAGQGGQHAAELLAVGGIAMAGMWLVTSRSEKHRLPARGGAGR